MTGASGRVNLLDLAAASLSSVMEVSAPIRELNPLYTNNLKIKNNKQISSDLKSHIKVDGTIVTTADALAQRIIIRALRRVSTHVRIVGEESAEDVKQLQDEQMQNCLEKLQNDQQDFSIEAKKELMKRRNTSRREADGFIRNMALEDDEVDASLVSIFVDPLDGTKKYAEGDFDVVTILIGIVVRNRPCFGIICKPFGQSTCLQTSSWGDPECFVVYGGVLVDGVYHAGGAEIRKSISYKLSDAIPNIPSSGRAIISSSRSGGIVRKCVDYLSQLGLLHQDPLMVSGAGEKSLRLILSEREETLWFFPKPATFLWDVAAGDAMLRVMGGRLSDKSGKDMDYSKSHLEAKNIQGIVASNDASLHAKCIQAYELEQWED